MKCFFGIVVLKAVLWKETNAGDGAGISDRLMK
jgi:hypothetical protein